MKRCKDGEREAHLFRVRLDRGNTTTGYVLYLITSVGREMGRKDKNSISRAINGINSVYNDTGER